MIDFKMGLALSNGTNASKLDCGTTFFDDIVSSLTSTQRIFAIPIYDLLLLAPTQLLEERLRWKGVVLPATCQYQWH